jgi:hypothetical protein
MEGGGLTLLARSGNPMLWVSLQDFLPIGNSLTHPDPINRLDNGLQLPL